MRLRAIGAGDAAGTAQRWKQLASQSGYEVIEDGPADVLCFFGGPRHLVHALWTLRRERRPVVWWCSSTTDLSARRQIEHALASQFLVLGRLARVALPDETLVGETRTAVTLAASLGIQAATVRNQGDDASFAQAMDDACKRAVGSLPSSARDPFVPREGHVLPYSVSHDVPGFTVPEEKRTYVFAPEPIRSEDWFNAFADRVETAIGREYLPVCRFSDGEYLFRFGWKPHLSNEPLWRRTASQARHAAGSLRPRAEFRAGMAGRYQSAQYTLKEQRAALAMFDSSARFLAQHGVLALHLSHVRRAFQRRFYPAVAAWIRELDLIVHTGNYVPFYFVYALLTGPRRRSILDGRRILVVNGATGDKRDRIIEGLRREGAEVVHWETISPARSLFDQVDVSEHRGHVDLALVGAGVGKVNVLPQLEVLGVPCIDAGYVFETWADPASSNERFYCAPDDSGIR